MKITASTAQFFLKILLLAAGGFLMCASFAVFLPVSAMASAHLWLGLGEFPLAPITVYLARSTSVLYAVHGLLMFYTGLTLKYHWRFVWLFGMLHVVIGLTMLVTDILAPMPVYWTVLEGGPVAALGFVILWLFRCGYSSSSGADG